MCHSDIVRENIRNGGGPSTGNSVAEAGVVVTEPLENPAVYAATKIADGLAPTLAAQYAPGDVGNATEAARHQLWQCVLATGVSQEYATKVGNAHEFGQTWTPDSRRDQYNNQAGRGLAANGQNCRDGVVDNLRTHRFPRVQDFNH
jgi:hypothetical protein